MSPHLAALAAGEYIDPSLLLAAARRAAEAGDVLVAEGIGGLLVPLSDSYLVRDFAADLGMPVVIAARPGLGTINHTLMTIECCAARRASRSPAWCSPRGRHRPERWSTRTARRSPSSDDVEVETLPALAMRAIGPQPHLPLVRWLGAAAPGEVADIRAAA